MKLEFYTHHKRGGLYVITDEFTLQMDGKHDHAEMVGYKNLLDGKKWVRLKSEFNDGRFEKKLIERADARQMIAASLGRQVGAIAKNLTNTRGGPASTRPKSSPPHHVIVPFPRPTLPDDRLDPATGLESTATPNTLSVESAHDFMKRIGHPMKTHVIRPDDSVEKELEWSVKKISEEFELLQVETDKGWYSIRRVHGSTVTGIVYRAIFREHLTHQIGMVQELGSVNELKEICFRHYKGMI